MWSRGPAKSAHQRGCTCHQCSSDDLQRGRAKQPSNSPQFKPLVTRLAMPVAWLQANLFIGLGLLSTAYALKWGGWIALLGLLINSACFTAAGKLFYTLHADNGVNPVIPQKAHHALASNSQATSSVMQGSCS